MSFRHRWPVFLLWLLSAVALDLLSGCAGSRHEDVVINTRHVPAVLDLPAEMTMMLEDLGYSRLPDTLSQRLGQSFEEYRMYFKANDDVDIRLEVRMQLLNKLTRIHLYTTGKTDAHTTLAQRYEVLQTRAAQEFGTQNVSVE